MSSLSVNIIGKSDIPFEINDMNSLSQLKQFLNTGDYRYIRVPFVSSTMGRNESCGCGSGKKFKKCCGK